MKPGAGKRKGNAAERDLCRRISLWITAGERDDTVWRSASSGAVFTVRNKAKKGGYNTQVGDLCSIDLISAPFFKKVAIESKHYADLQLSNMICGLPSKAEKFWLTHKELCNKAGKEPWAVMRQNRKPDLLFISNTFFDTVVESCKHVLMNSAVAHFPRMGCSIYVLEDFLKTFPYAELFVG